MKAELNERNEVVVTMSKGEAQRVAKAAWRYESNSKKQTADCIEFAQEIEAVGIEFIFD